MTVTADTKKRVVIPGAAPGDVYACHETGDGVLLRRVYRPSAAQPRKLTKAEALKAIRSWKFTPAMTWDELRKVTREP